MHGLMYTAVCSVSLVAHVAYKVLLILWSGATDMQYEMLEFFAGSATATKAFLDKGKNARAYDIDMNPTTMDFMSESGFAHPSMQYLLACMGACASVCSLYVYTYMHICVSKAVPLHGHPSSAEQLPAHCPRVFVLDGGFERNHMEVGHQLCRPAQCGCCSQGQYQDVSES